MSFFIFLPPFLKMFFKGDPLVLFILAVQFSFVFAIS